MHLRTQETFKKRKKELLKNLICRFPFTRDYLSNPSINERKIAERQHFIFVKSFTRNFLKYYNDSLPIKRIDYIKNISIPDHPFKLKTYLRMYMFPFQLPFQSCLVYYGIICREIAFHVFTCQGFNAHCHRTMRSWHQ